MKKQTMAVVLAAAFVVAVAGAVWAANCDVVGTKGNEVTLKCDDASKLKAGDKVTLKAAAAAKHKGKIEGC